MAGAVRDSLSGGTPPEPTRPRIAGAIILTGGSGRRLGGRDKATIELPEGNLLTRIVRLTEPLPTVVVGHRRGGLPARVGFTREQPAGSGPAAAALAGLSALLGAQPLATQGWVYLLAVDQPYLTPHTLRRLEQGAWNEPSNPGQPTTNHAGVDVSWLVDATERVQYLCGLYRIGALLEASARFADPTGLPLHRLTSGLRGVAVAAQGEEARDIDTPSDLARLEAHPPQFDDE